MSYFTLGALIIVVILLASRIRAAGRAAAFGRVLRHRLLQSLPFSQFALAFQCQYSPIPLKINRPKGNRCIFPLVVNFHTG